MPSNKAKPLDEDAIKAGYTAGESCFDLARKHRTHMRRIAKIVGHTFDGSHVSKPKQPKTPDPAYEVAITISYTEIQLNEALTNLSIDEKVEALQAAMMRRMGVEPA